MTELKFYDKDLNYIKSIYKAISTVWTLKYRGFGSFEAHFSINQDIGKLIKDNKFLIVCQGEKQALITSKEIFSDKIILYGKELSYILYKKIVPVFSARNGQLGSTTGEIAQNILDMVLDEEGNITVTNIETLSYEMNNTWSIVPKPLSDVLNNLCQKDNSGYSFKADIKNKKWILNFYKGNEINLALSESNKNAHSVNYSETLENYALDSYFYSSYQDMGEWNGEINQPSLTDFTPENYGKKYRVTVSGSLGDKQFEKGGYVICKTEDGELLYSDIAEGFWKIKKIDDAETGLWRWQRTTSETDEDDVYKELLNNLLDNTIKLKTRNIKYGKDYNLGDVFSVKFEKNGLTFTKKVKVYSVRIFEDEIEKGERPQFKEEE